MRKNKELALKYLIIISSCVGGILALRQFESPNMDAMVMWGVTIIAMIIVKFDVFHPYVWFSILFSLYSTAYAIIIGMGYMEPLGYSQNNLLYSFIALMTVLLIVGPQRVDIKKRLKKSTSINNVTLKKIVYFCSIALIIITVSLITRGYSGKSEMKQAKDIFYQMGIYLVRYGSMFMTLLLCDSIEHNRKGNKIAIGLSVFSAILFSMSTGERDAMFRAIALLLLVLVSYNKINKKQTIVLIPLFMIFMILSVKFKYFFIRNEINTSYTEDNNILYLFLCSDFSAAGRNIQKLLLNSWTKGYAGFGLIITEIIGTFFPSSTFFNPDHWFNYEVYNNTFHGRAFTLVGVGYIISGLVGIIVLFTILGFFIKMLYKKSKNNLYTMSIYMYMIPSIAFSFRQSFSSVSSAFIRITLVSVLICKLISNPKNTTTNMKEGVLFDEKE